MISIDDFKKVEIRVGKILSAEKVTDADKLLRLSVDFGLKLSVNEDGSPKTEADIRQIVSGISAYFPDPSTLVGKNCPFAVNLEPRMIRGLESNGMILAVGNADGFFSLLESSSDTPPGSTVK
ncbi:hypothetical protein K8Q93_01195 [Candidatus Parcubacteria bacterium]|nr:hypothetical protein [Candidatus Parcubacteria bacterium]